MSRKLKIAALIISLSLFVLLLIAPITKSLNSNIEVLETEVDINSKIEMAVDLVQNGSNPMEGIMLLREVLEEDSTNVSAHWQLGQLSMQSGQYAKAISRFEKVEKYSVEETNARFFIGQSYLALGDRSKAIENFNFFKELRNDSLVNEQIDELINNIDNNN